MVASRKGNYYILDGEFSEGKKENWNNISAVKSQMSDIQKGENHSRKSFLPRGSHKCEASYLQKLRKPIVAF